MNNTKVNEQEAAQNQLLASLGRIYSFVKSREYTKTIVNFSFDDYINQAKEQIKSSDKTTRPTKYRKLELLEDEINTTIEKTKQLKQNNESDDN